MGWLKEEGKLHPERSEPGFVCNLIPTGHLQYSTGAWLLLCCFFILLRGFFSFLFFPGYFVRDKSYNELFNTEGTPYHSNLTSQRRSFSNGKHTLSFLFTLANTHFQMSADFFFFLTCRYHLLKLDLAFT